MGKKIDANPIASAFVQMTRWAKATPEEKAQEGKRLAAARWKGHKAKRPAASRKKAAAK